MFSSVNRRALIGSLIRCLQKLDWELVERLPFIGATRARSLFMFQKRMPIGKPS